MSVTLISGIAGTTQQTDQHPCRGCSGKEPGCQATCMDFSLAARRQARRREEARIAAQQTA